jgi:thioesterase domain-containing protein
MVELERLALRLPDQLDGSTADWCDSVAFVPVSAPPAPATVRAQFVAPRTRLEHELATIWEGLFKVAPIGVLDDFFALGGHSLLVLQMAARMRAAIGIELPLHVLVSATTIETLARMCAGDEDATAIVPLSTSGVGRAIYCPHPLGGHVLCYAALGRRLAGRHQAWGLEAKGLLAGETPVASWTELIAHHWALLTEARSGVAGHPFDGVALVGYSYGGYIALELAARALREGATRVPVVLLDVPHPSVISAEHRAPDAATLLHALFGHALGLDLAEMRRQPAGTLTRHVFDTAVAQHLIPSETPFEQVARILAVAQAHSRISPPVARYGFPVVLCRAREGAERISALPDLGWDEQTDGLSIEWVAGSHETMLDSAFSADLAEVVTRYFC